MLDDKPLMRFVQMVQHWFNRNTRRQARRNIHAHYDIGNAFYSAWLDPSMTYSSALFEDDTTDLTAAQNNKYRRLAEAIDLQPGQKLLEIGCATRTESAHRRSSSPAAFETMAMRHGEAAPR